MNYRSHRRSAVEHVLSLRMRDSIISLLGGSRFLRAFRVLGRLPDRVSMRTATFPRSRSRRTARQSRGERNRLSNLRSSIFTTYRADPIWSPGTGRSLPPHRTAFQVPQLPTAGVSWSTWQAKTLERSHCGTGMSGATLVLRRRGRPRLPDLMTAHDPYHTPASVSRFDSQIRCVRWFTDLSTRSVCAGPVLYFGCEDVVCSGRSTHRLC